MATRRKYRTPRGYKSGGAVTPEDSADVTLPPATPSDEVTIDVPPPVEVETAADGGSVPPPVPGDDAVTQAIQATIRAEEMQRQQMSVEQYINAIPGLSDHKRDFLKRFPLLLQLENAQAMRKHHQAGLRAGIPDDSAEMDEHLVSGMKFELEARRQRQVDAANAGVAAMQPPPVPERSIEQDVDQLDREASAIGGMMQAEAATPMAIAEQVEATPSLPKRKSIPTSMPVTRSIPTLSGKPAEDYRSVTLSREQRIVARNSFGAIKDASGNLVDLTPEQKERMYAANLIKMRKMRAEGQLE
jgi:hypothetical protein